MPIEKKKTLSFDLDDLTCTSCDFHAIWDSKQRKFISMSEPKGEPMLTLKRLKDIKHREIFAKGCIVDSRDGINMNSTGRLLKWVACRGDALDWAIYCDWDFKSFAQIRSNGCKVHEKKNIIKLIPCDADAFARYRH